MRDLLARFRLVDEMSERLENISRSGQRMSDILERAGSTATSAFVRCVRAGEELGNAIDDARSKQENLSTAMDKAARAAEELVDNENVSTEAKEKLAQANENAQEAFDELAAAQERAQQAQEEYDQLIASGTTDIDELERAAQNAADASADLERANQRASDATDELADATRRASREAEEGGEHSENAIEQLSNALAAAGITAAVHQIADAFMAASAAEFEDGVAKIATIADTSQTSLSAISADIVSLSADTGESVNDLSEAVYSAISASVDTADAVEFTGTATKLAAGGFTSSATAVDVLTTALNAYGLEAGEAENISDMLITTQNLGKTTVDELAASVGKVIPLASAYGVEMDNLSSAYAELTKGGIATAEAGTYLKSMLSELGDSGSTVSGVLIEKTGYSFAQLTKQGYSLGDVLSILGDSVNGDAGAFNELWSSSEAGVGALSLYNAGAEQFNTTLDAMQHSVGATTSAYETMNDTTTGAQEDLANAAANLQIAIGQQINPLISKLYNLGTNVLTLMTDFAQEHPILIKAISAIAVGLGTVAIAIAGVAAASATFGMLSTAVTTFATAVNAALGPVGWVAIGITAVVAAGGALIAMLEGAEDETAGMTATTREQYYELQNLNAEYEQACEKYGETSEEASRLKYQVDDLSASFEANRQTVEEFTAEVDALCESVSTIASDFDSAQSEIQANESGTLALIQKYDDLSSKANLTAAEEQALAAVTKQLSSQYPELAENLDGAAGGTEDYVKALKKACEQEAKEQRQQQAQETYIEALQKREALTEELTKAQENLNLEQQRMDNMSGFDHFFTGGEWDDLNAYKDAVAELEAAISENDATIAQIEQSWNDLAKTEEEAGMNVISWEESAATAYEGVKTRVEELCTAYDDAYTAAMESFQGQFGLFDQASTSSEEYLNATVANAQAALDSQLAYWESYGANIETLKSTSAADLGITQENYNALMSYVQSGSEEAAGLAASMTQAINSGNTEAVAALANTVGEVNAKQEEISAATADWQTDFTAQMDAIELEMQSTVEGMNLSEEANASATATISGYADAIRAGKGDAVAAAEEVAKAVSRALSNAQTNLNVNVSSSGSVSGHAKGTTNAEDIFVAGEEGPELIVGKAGSTVFPADETAKIVNAVSDFSMAQNATPTIGQSAAYVDDAYSVHAPDDISDQPVPRPRTTSPVLQQDSQGTAANMDASGGVNEKKIVIEVAGSGSIEVSGNKIDDNAVLELLMQNLKPALMQIVRDECFEEGDGSYEY